MTEVSTQSLVLYASAVRDALPSVPGEARLKADILTTLERLKAIAKNTNIVTGSTLFNELIGGLGVAISQLCLEHPVLAAPGKHGHRGRVFPGLLDA